MDTSSPAATSDARRELPHRRGFLSKLAAMGLGGLLTAIPLAAGVWSFLDSLRRRQWEDEANYIRVAPLDAVPDDGTPRYFPLVTVRRDAWNLYPRQPVGAVYLRRVGSEVQAFNVSCPHAGCFVNFDAAHDRYLCPCHNSAFTLDGEVVQPSPSPRGLDALAIDPKKLADGEVWVEFA